jgi:hypothetical protein
MEHAKMLGVFDIIVGTSAGAYSAAFFIGGEAIRGTRGYWTVMPAFVRDGHFFAWSRLLRGLPVLDVQAVVEKIFSDTVPIPWERIISSAHNLRGAFYIQALDAQTGRIVLLRRFRSAQALKSAIVGSCWLPLLAGLRPYMIPERILEDMEVIEVNCRSTIKRDRLLLFDGSVADYYMLQAKEFMANSLNVYCDPLHPNQYPRFAGLFGQKFAALETVAARILFGRYRYCLPRYQEHILRCQRSEHAKALLARSRRADTDHVLINPEGDIALAHNETSPLHFKTAVLSGWTAAARCLPLEDPDPPPEWAA